jgi:hypothetical protein
MPGPQVDRLVERLLQALPRVGNLDEAKKLVLDELEGWNPGLSKILQTEFAEAVEIVARQFENIEILQTHSLMRPRTQWYFGPKPTDLHWPAVREYLLNHKQWKETDAQRLDDNSNEVVSLLENPNTATTTRFSARGLVVGYVQSGKTANMTGVIAKALDAGYTTVIILAGLTNKLRFQTQLRIYNDLVARNPMNWQVLTANEIDKDFKAPPVGGFLSLSDKAQIAIIKKNVNPLRELELAISRTIPAVLERLRILVIDDECDQASVNAATSELDTTAINLRIREILQKLPAATYVGYTATPFANVLINPYPTDSDALDDLYPRDFITTLPRAETYFGTSALFGTQPANPEKPLPEEEGLDMIREIPPEDETQLQPKSRRDRTAFQPTMPASLASAILYFLACCAARHARGNSAEHMSMLVHTSAFVAIHTKVAELIEDWVNANRDSILNRNSALAKQLESLWQSEQNRLPANITSAKPVTAGEIFEHLGTVLRHIEFPVENGDSADRIDYGTKPRTYIIVGGSILARGLTLEGLMVSYFLRTANQYDTLLQMGRWFGYRPNYEDLPRLWMPEQLKLRFRALASIEQEIRDDIDQYRINKCNPMQFAVRVRSIPGMAITTPSKMRAARRCAVSYWGTHRQTFRFEHKNRNALEKNWQIASDMINATQALGLRDTTTLRKLWRNVPKTTIRRFFQNYQVHSSHVDLQTLQLTGFLDSTDTRLNLWNIGIVEGDNNRPSENALGIAGSVSTITRSKIKENGDVADIKALMSKTDLLFDCPKIPEPPKDWTALKEARFKLVGQIPLLLLYPINKLSTPLNKSEFREPLNAAHDVLGFGIVFPGSVIEGGNFVSVELPPLTVEEVTELEEEEREIVEAASAR